VSLLLQKENQAKNTEALLELKEGVTTFFCTIVDGAIKKK